MSVFFNDREGNTVLSAGEQAGLRLRHIHQMKDLDEAEQININEGLLWLSRNKKKDILHPSFFCRLHKQLFGQVWNWAGKYRTTEKNIGIDYWKVPSALKKLCDDTEYWIENETYPWPELIARFHHRLVSIHPFPNGNGRFSRILTNHLCKIHGKPQPSWKASLPPKERRSIYIHALRKADVRKMDPIIHFFQE